MADESKETAKPKQEPEKKPDPLQATPADPRKEEKPQSFTFGTECENLKTLNKKGD
jgi:hypothetical protein